MAFERKHYNMDMDWRFHRGEIADDGGKSHASVYSSTKTGGLNGPATKRSYDDSSWQRVDLPHDYIRESAYTPDGVGSHGYRELCDAWYRKTFVVDAALVGKHAMLVFDGISTASTVFLNGSVIYRSSSIYSEIAIDVTDRLHFGRVNTLAVYTKGDATEGWWYEGAGIYRHVHLYIKDSIHIANNGIWAKPTLCDKGNNLWKVELETTLENSEYAAGSAKVRAKLFDGEREIAFAESGETICAPDAKTPMMLTLDVSDPTRWDVDCPKLYTLETETVVNGESVDKESTRIGFRTFRMDADKGFFLNDRPMKIKGTCNHQDHAGLGVALPDSMQYYRVKLLKEMGTNAYRCSHNPPAKEILDACDELGLIVMDENRNFETRREAIDNLETLIRRDRNHPSVIFYSLFNEEPLQNSAEGAAIFRRLKSTVLRLDDTRIITGAVNDTLCNGGTGEEMDAFGLNYHLELVEDIHREFPGIPIYGSENNSAVTTRGCYKSDREGAHVLNNYDEETVPWGTNVRDAWEVVRSHDYFAGLFIWTGFDYRGEPTPFEWPTASSLFGIMDSCGFPKDSYYFNKATFTDEPMMHILPHWNMKEGESVRVMTVTNCEEVELFVNGRSQGRRKNDVCRQNEWNVTFEKGTLSAVGYNNGKAVVSDEKKTAGDAVAVKLVADRTSIGNAGQDIVPVRVSLVDKDGVELPDADDLVTFEIEGDGIVAGVGNGDPNSHEPEHTPYRHLFAGLCQVLVKAELGARSLRLVARSGDLESASITFDIIDEKTPDYIFSKPNNSVSGVLVSLSDSETKPDPEKIYGSDDNNSFAPLVLDNGFDYISPDKFRSGWRELRVPIRLPASLGADKKTSLECATVICERLEAYIDGKLIYETEPEYKACVAIPFDMPAGSEFEMRILVKAKEGLISGSGFAVSMSLVTEDK